MGSCVFCEIAAGGLSSAIKKICRRYRKVFGDEDLLAELDG